jgi:hypothetical protein
MKTLVLKFFFLFLSIESALACPSCAGSMNNPKEKYIVYILGGFILLTYIPFYLIYRTIIKHRHADQLVNESTNSEVL